MKRGSRTRLWSCHYNYKSPGETDLRRSNSLAAQLYACYRAMCYDFTEAQTLTLYARYGGDTAACRRGISGESNSRRPGRGRDLKSRSCAPFRGITQCPHRCQRRRSLHSARCTKPLAAQHGATAPAGSAVPTRAPGHGISCAAVVEIDLQQIDVVGRLTLIGLVGTVPTQLSGLSELGSLHPC